MNTTTQPGSLKLKTIFKVIPEERQQLVQGKDADNIRKVLYADTLKVSSGALIEVTLLFRYSTTDREATRVLALFGHLSEWQFN